MLRGVHRAGAHRHGCARRGAKHGRRSDQTHRRRHRSGAIDEHAVGDVALLAVGRNVLHRRPRVTQTPRGDRGRTAAVERHPVNAPQRDHQRRELGPRQTDARRGLATVHFDEQQGAVARDRRAGRGNALRVFAAAGPGGVVVPIAVAQDQRAPADRVRDRVERDRSEVASRSDDVAGIRQTARAVRLRSDGEIVAGRLRLQVVQRRRRAKARERRRSVEQREPDQRQVVFRCDASELRRDQRDAAVRRRHLVDGVECDGAGADLDLSGELQLAKPVRSIASHDQRITPVGRVQDAAVANQDVGRTVGVADVVVVPVDARDRAGSGGHRRNGFARTGETVVRGDCLDPHVGPARRDGRDAHDDRARCGDQRVLRIAHAGSDRFDGGRLREDRGKGAAGSRRAGSWLALAGASSAQVKSEQAASAFENPAFTREDATRRRRADSRR